MHEASIWSSTSQDILAGCIADEQLWIGQYSTERIHFVHNQWRILVWYSHQQSWTRSIHLLPRANCVDTRAWGIRNTVIVDHISLSVEQGMKRNVMQRSMWHKQQVLGLDSVAQESKELII